MPLYTTTRLARKSDGSIQQEGRKAFENGQKHASRMGGFCDEKTQKIMNNRVSGSNCNYSKTAILNIIIDRWGQNRFPHCWQPDAPNSQVQHTPGGRSEDVLPCVFPISFQDPTTCFKYLRYETPKDPPPANLGTILGDHISLENQGMGDSDNHTWKPYKF